MASLTISMPRSSSVLSESVLPTQNHNISNVSSSLSPSPSPSASDFSRTLSNGSSSRDDENVTITPARRRSLFRDEDNDPTVTPVSRRSMFSKGRKSDENLQLLALSNRITELTYTISDIQTRIFEIQELRHKSQSSADASHASGVIDQSLALIDERLENVSVGIKSIGESLTPLLRRAEQTPTVGEAMSGEEELILREHEVMMAEWDALQKDISVLREELKEDKWLTVFRTVTDQADGMMSSLEKAVNRCQDFIWQVHRGGYEDSMSQSSSTSSLHAEHPPINHDVFNSLLESFEAKKKHYMPATTKVLSIIDKGVQDRVTKNGECLRRHAESTQRWRNLKDRIARTDAEMENVRRMFDSVDLSPSEAGSSTSAVTSLSKGSNGLLSTPLQHRSPGPIPLSLTRSIPPLRKIARKLKGPKSPLQEAPTPPSKDFRAPSTEPSRGLRPRSSMMHFSGSPSPVPMTPSHRHSHSVTPESSPSTRTISRPAWNSSTKVVSDDRAATVKASTQRPSLATMYSFSEGYEKSIPPLPPMYPANRSVSRSSMGSSRPWSPVTSSVSSSNPPNSFSMYRPPSRAVGKTSGLPYTRPPSRSQGQAAAGLPVSPRTRPKTPSHIPTPLPSHVRSISGSPGGTEWDLGDPSLILHRALSPTSPRSHTPGGSALPVRPPSRSMIPIPSVHVSSASRPSSAMSHYRPGSSMAFRGSTNGPMTPDGSMAKRAPRMSLISGRMPPSSFRGSASPHTPGSRPASRAGAIPMADLVGGGKPLHEYIPGNPRDPLDVGIANVANSIAHVLTIERVDPPLRGMPKEGEEIRAQYAFTGPLVRKVVNCKLTTLARPGAKGPTKKVMCRVGGGWQDLPMYLQSRQT